MKLETNKLENIKFDINFMPFYINIITTYKR